MPKKFAFFKSACIINLICLSILLANLIYITFIRYGRIRTDDIMPLLVILFGLLIYFLTAIRGLYLIRRYNTMIGISKPAVNSLILLFIIVLLFQIVTFISLINEWRYFLYHVKLALYYRRSGFLILALLLPFIIFLLTLYWQIFVFNLVTAVKARHAQVVNAIDEIGNSPKQ